MALSFFLLHGIAACVMACNYLLGDVISVMTLKCVQQYLIGNTGLATLANRPPILNLAAAV
jgi:hypothetical protein